MVLIMYLHMYVCCKFGLFTTWDICCSYVHVHIRIMTHLLFSIMMSLVSFFVQASLAQCLC